MIHAIDATKKTPIDQSRIQTKCGNREEEAEEHGQTRPLEVVGDDRTHGMGRRAASTARPGSGQLWDSAV